MQLVPVIVITGSASGIGYGLAEAFVARGCKVMLSDLPGDRLDAATARLGTPALVASQACDVSQRAQVQDLWDAAIARFGLLVLLGPWLLLTVSYFLDQLAPDASSCSVGSADVCAPELFFGFARLLGLAEIGRASCRERVFSSV